MRPLDLFAEASSILFLGAHPDDVEIECGATIRRIARLHPDVEMRIIVLTSTEERAAEAKSAAQRFVGKRRRGDHSRVSGRAPSVGGEPSQGCAHGGRFGSDARRRTHPSPG